MSTLTVVSCSLSSNDTASIGKYRSGPTSEYRSWFYWTSRSESWLPALHIGSHPSRTPCLYNHYWCWLSLLCGSTADCFWQAYHGSAGTNSSSWSLRSEGSKRDCLGSYEGSCPLCLNNQWSSVHSHFQWTIWNRSPVRISFNPETLCLFVWTMSS